MRRVALHAILAALVVGAAGCHKPAAPPADNASVASVAATPADNVTAHFVAVKPAAEPPAPLDNAALAPSAEAPATEETAPPEPPPARPLRPVKRVVVDPGHGGDNVGAVVGAVAEREVNLDVGLKLAELLRRKGFDVTLTRVDDASVSLEDRAEVANAAGADLFISLHSNAAANTEASGIEIYFPTEIFRQNGRIIDDDARARDIATRNLPDGPFTWDGEYGVGVTPERLALDRDLGQTLGLDIERAMTGALGTTSRGVKPAGYEVLRWAACPAVLVEMGFLSNDDDRVKLADAGYRTRIAKSIADAVSAYGNLAPPVARE